MNEGHSHSNVVTEIEDSQLTTRIAAFVRQKTSRRSLADTHAEPFRTGPHPNGEGRREIANESGSVHNQRDSKRLRMESRNEGDNQHCAVVCQQSDNAPREDEQHDKTNSNRPKFDLSTAKSVSSVDKISAEVSSGEPKDSGQDGHRPVEPNMMNPIPKVLQPVASSSANVPSRNSRVDL